MSREYIIGIDIGTMEIKAVVFDSNGKKISEADGELPIYFLSSGNVEQDLDEIFKECLSVIKKVVRLSKVDRRKIMALAFTGQRETICPLDNRGRPLTRALSWQDTRGWEICKWMKEKVGAERIYTITGLPVNTMPSASKIIWIKQNHPEIYEKTWKFAGVVDYIVWKFAGKLYMDYSNANRTMLFDIRRLSWSDELFNTFRLEIEKMPELIPSGTIVGKLLKELSQEIRLPQNCKIIYGGGDQQCTALGAGIVSSGKISCVLGTCTNIEAYSENIPYDPTMSLQSQVHVVPNAYLCEGGIGTSGVIYRWFRDEFARQEIDVARRLNLSAYELLDREVARIPPGARGVLLIPYFAGTLFPYWNAKDRGVIVGLHLMHKREHIIRAILEGVAFEFRKMLEITERTTSSKIKLVRFVGGGAKSSLWPQIFVDILGIPGEILAVKQAGALGAAILGMVSLGWFKNESETVEKIIKTDKRLEPNVRNHELYNGLYKIHKEIYPRIQNLVTKISELTEKYENSLNYFIH